MTAWDVAMPRQAHGGIISDSGFESSPEVRSAECLVAISTSVFVQSARNPRSGTL